MESVSGGYFRARIARVFTYAVALFSLATAFPIYGYLSSLARKNDTAALKSQLAKMGARLESESSRRWAEMESYVQRSGTLPKGWTTISSEDLKEASKVPYVRSLEVQKNEVRFWILTEHKQYKGILPLSVFLSSIYRAEGSPFSQYALFDAAEFQKGDLKKALLGQADAASEAFETLGPATKNLLNSDKELEVRSKDRAFTAVAEHVFPSDFDAEGLLLVGMSDLTATKAKAFSEFARVLAFWFVTATLAIFAVQFFSLKLSKEVLEKLKPNLPPPPISKVGGENSGKLPVDRTGELNSKTTENFLNLQLTADELSRAFEFIEAAKKIHKEEELASAAIAHFTAQDTAIGNLTSAVWIHYSEERSTWLTQSSQKTAPEFLGEDWSAQLESYSQNPSEDPGSKIQDFLSAYLATQGFIIGNPEVPQVRIFLVSQNDGGRPSIFALQSGPHESLTDRSWSAYQKILETTWVACLRTRLLDQTIERDPLTSLYNRDYLATLLQGLESRYQSDRQTFSLILFDIDHFKKINNRYGKTAADQILQALTQKMRVYFSAQNGKVCRLGGEEFVVVLEDFDANQTMIIADEFRQLIERASFNVSGPGNTPLVAKITLSGGVSGCPTHASEPNDLISAADAALSESKSQGRNTVSEAAVPTRLRQAA